LFFNESFLPKQNGFLLCGGKLTFDAPAAALVAALLAADALDLLITRDLVSKVACALSSCQVVIL